MKNIVLSLAMLFALNAGVIPAYSATNAALSTNTNADYLGSFYNQDDAAAQRAKNIQPPNPIWTVIKVILYVGVFGVAAYFIVKFVLSKGAVPATEDADIVEVIMTKPAGMGSYLQIVKVGPTYYLLGLSGDGLRYIDKITDKETLDYIDLNKDKIKPKETKFFDFLTYLPLNKKPDRMDFLKNQKDKLKKL